MDVERAASTTKIGTDNNVSRGVRSHTHTISTCAPAQPVRSGGSARDCNRRDILVAMLRMCSGIALHGDIEAGRNVELRFGDGVARDVGWLGAHDLCAARERVGARCGACGDSRSAFVARGTRRRDLEAGRNVELRFGDGVARDVGWLGADYGLAASDGQLCAFGAAAVV